MISFNEARRYVEELKPLGVETVSVHRGLRRVLAQDVYGLVDAPPMDSSLKDGYALRAEDIHGATRDAPVLLQVVGTLVAGQRGDISIGPGQAVKVMTGVELPPGADAVLPQELTGVSGDSRDTVLCQADTFPGRNVLKRGTDIRSGELLLRKDTYISPALIGLLTGAGITRIPVYKIPRVAIIATGSELAEEGQDPESGKIFPSNRATILGWLNYFGIEGAARLCRDDYHQLIRLFKECLETYDVVITSGGVLDGERDLVVSSFEDLGVDFWFKRVKMGPGKGVCMGRRGNVLVFNLPGGPPSNYVAFLFIALASILRLTGVSHGFPGIVKATLSCDVRGRDDWTQFILAKVHYQGHGWWAEPVPGLSRLRRIALANGVIIIPEGKAVLKAGHLADVALIESGPGVSAPVP